MPRRTSENAYELSNAGLAEPAVNLGRLVGRDIVDDQVHIDILGNRPVDQVQEPAELGRSVSIGHVGDDLA